MLYITKNNVKYGYFYKNEGSILFQQLFYKK